MQVKARGWRDPAAARRGRARAAEPGQGDAGGVPCLWFILLMKVRL